MSEPFVCRVGDVVRRGAVVTVPESVPPGRVAEAVAESSNPEDRIAVESAPVTPLHDHVGCIRPEMGLRTQTALARAARTRGLGTPQDPDIDSVCVNLVALANGDESDEVAEETGTATRYESPSAGGEDVDALRERVATARGRLQARRRNGLDPTPAAEALSEAIAALSEAETATAARRQRREVARTEARAERDRLDKRLRLEDRLANLKREARAHLVDEVREPYRECLNALPGHEPGEDPLEAPAVPAALAIVRLATIRAPVVLAVDRFASPAAAGEWLDTALIQV